MADSPIQPGIRYSGFRFPAWQMTLEAAVKIPVAGERLLLSTGRTDYGVQVSLQRLGNHHAFYGNLAAVYYRERASPCRRLRRSYRRSFSATNSS